MARDFHDILADCLEAIEAGQMTTQQCLDAHPAHRDELAELLLAADQMRQVAEADEYRAMPSPAFKLGAKSRLLSKIAPEVVPATVPPSPPIAQPTLLETVQGWLFGRNKAAGFALASLLVLFLVGGGTLFASNRAIPGDALYGMKTQLEERRVNQVADSAELIDVQLELSDERLTELEQLVEAERVELIEPTSERYSGHMRSAVSKISQLDDASQAEIYTETLTDRLIQHEPRIEDIATIVENMPATTTEAAAIQSMQKVIGDSQSFIASGIWVDGVANATLLDVIQNNAEFSAFASAIETAGLTGMLEQDGPITLFAPTNQVFEALQTEWDSLQNDSEQLRATLQYHAIGEPLLAADLPDINFVKTLQGYDMAILNKPEGLLLNDSVMLVTTDIQAANGVLHVVDQILLPPARLFELLVEDGNFTIFTAVLEQTGLNWQLLNNGPFTLFAPTDDAFAQLAPGVWDGILADPVKLRQTLLYHYLQGNISAETLFANQTATSALGEPISFGQANDGQLLVNGIAKGISGNVRAANGVLHVIDQVLIPENYP